jgi:hypothetical protein
MIAPEIAAEIRRLLDEDVLSQRKIARRTGISRGTVAAIAAGRRGDCDAVSKPGEDSWETSSDPPERCPTCGSLVYMPCLLCRLRNKLSEERLKPARRRTADAPAWLILELRPEHQRRYEEIRR